MGKVNSQNRARQAWGDKAPDWVMVMATACDKTSQSKVAAALGYSSTVVSIVLKNEYAGDLSAVEQAVRGAFMQATVSCPVRGELPGNECLQLQRRPFAATNPQRVRLFKACRSGCKHYRGH